MLPNWSETHDALDPRPRETIPPHFLYPLEKLYHHIFSTPEHDSTSIDHLKHDLTLWLSHHSFEELPVALEYYLADPNSDLEADLTHLNLLDKRGVQVTISPVVTIYICTLLAWTKCFLATYGEYPGLYDLLDTPRSVFIAASYIYMILHFVSLSYPTIEAPLPSEMNM